MARVIRSSFVDVAGVQVGEKRLVDFLAAKLPEEYVIIPNAEYPSDNCGVVQYWEYDCLVVAPHGLYNIENKDWRGDLWGNDQHWYLNGVRKPNPMKTCRRKSSILASCLKLHDWDLGAVWIDSMVTLSNPHQTKMGFSPSDKSTKRIFLLNDELIAHITDPSRINKEERCVSHLRDRLISFLCDQNPNPPEHVVPTGILEFTIKTVIADEQDDAFYKEYIAETKGLVKSLKRVKVWRMDFPLLDDEKRRERKLQIQNQNAALTRIGENPNIFRSEFRFSEESQQFFEISDYIPDSALSDVIVRRDLTNEEKLEIIFGICSALRAVHAKNVVHRSVRPENIVYHNRTARLTNFNRAFFEEHTTADYTMLPDGVAAATLSAYDAPEIVEGKATAASDVYSLGVLVYYLYLGKLPVANFYDLNQKGGVLPENLWPSRINALLPHWLDGVVRRAIAIDPGMRWRSVDEIHDYIKSEISASVTPGAAQAAATAAAEVPLAMEAGAKATNDLTLVEEIGHGGYSRVFKAHHALMDCDYAIKIYNESVSVASATDEYKALKDLRHDHIVRFQSIGTTNNGQFYTLMEYLHGNNLGKYAGIGGDLHLPLADVYRLADEMTDVLVYLQDRPEPIFHRDVKPLNIVWDEQRRFVLIDFNIAAVEADDTHLVGTRPYLPPDLIVEGTRVAWDKSADPFALGVTLYELVCRAYPWTGVRMPQPGQAPVDPRELNPNVSERFAAFLLKSIACSSAERFADAMEMRRALKEIGPDGIWADARPVATTLDTADTEQYVKYLNSLYSQSRHGNKGTRTGVEENPFDQATYVPTKLDTKLLSAICDGAYRLVVITGNAGDGKTAFLKRIEQRAQNVKRFESLNGAEFTIAGMHFRSNYDGSQDEKSKVNDEVLREFFRPFEDRDDFASAPEGRIIAINEGRLADFLEKEPKLAKLGEVIDGYFAAEGKAELPPGVMVVNLNLRSVTARDENGDSLFRRQVKAVCAPQFWTKCAGCPSRGRCFIRYNVESLTDPAAGDEVVSRLEWLLRMVSYRRELHLTIRDLRSFIAFMITGDRRCEDVDRIYFKNVDSPEEYWRYFYFNAAGDDGVASEDRLVKLLRSTDVAHVAIPVIDRELYFNLHDPKNFNRFEARTLDPIAMFNKVKEENSARDADDRKRNQLRLRHRMQIRHHYLEGSFDAFEIRRGYFARLPYQSLWKFDALLKSAGSAELDSAMKALATAVTFSEGCTTRQFSENYLLLSASHVPDPHAKTYRRFPLGDFELVIDVPRHLVSYLEYENSRLLFRSRTDETVRLDVSLDLYEMLYAISRGFSPSVNDLQGHFIELKVFKTLLENKRYDEVLVTRNDREFHLVKLDPETNRIMLENLSEGN